MPGMADGRIRDKYVERLIFRHNPDWLHQRIGSLAFTPALQVRKNRQTQHQVDVRGDELSRGDWGRGDRIAAPSISIRREPLNIATRRIFPQSF